MSRRPPAAHGLVDYDPYLAVVRCDEGDVETFMRLAAEELSRQGVEPEHFVDIKAPVWRWFRINPCGGDCREHAWHADEYHEAGRGRWRGAFVELGLNSDRLRP